MPGGAAMPELCSRRASKQGRASSSQLEVRACHLIRAGGHGGGMMRSEDETSLGAQREVALAHGWIVKKTFSVALSGVPPRDELFRRLAPRLKAAPPQQLEAACVRELGECEVAMRRVFESMHRSFDQLGLDDRRKA